MTTFIEMHALRSFPPSNLNRDDLGTPKTAVFGGTRRLRISSQCLKRTWRTSEHFRGAFAESELGVRTDRLPEEVLKAIGDSLGMPAKDGIVALLASLGRKRAKEKPGGQGDDEASSSPEPSTAVEAADATRRTAHLLFLSWQEIEAVAAFAHQKAEALAKVFNDKKIDVRAIDKLRAELRVYLASHTAKNPVDVGLFGRFVTSDEFDTVDGALQVAHALGTQKVEIEYDYFTAMDDLGDTKGARHLGESEYASSVLYLYACCDLRQLEENLGRRGSEGRHADRESRALARKSLPILVRAMAEATPRGKKTGTAPHTPAEYVEVIVRRGAPVSFANAFIKPVSAREADGDVMMASISRLAAHRERIEAAYGRDEDVAARFVVCLREVDPALAGAGGTFVKSIAELAERLGATLDGLPSQNQP